MKCKHLLILILAAVTTSAAGSVTKISAVTLKAAEKDRERTRDPGSAGRRRLWPGPSSARGEYPSQQG